jgi:ABC-type antimicrobial peptide transport system permease subunit
LTALAAFFGIVSLLLAAAGVYGALDYSIVSRRRELGIRLAVGAQATHIAKTVGGRMMLAVAIGVGFGLFAALATVEKLHSLLFGVAPRDLAAFFVTTAGVIGCSIVAALIPLFRAIKTDPLSALRAE